MASMMLSNILLLFGYEKSRDHHPGWSRPLPLARRPIGLGQEICCVLLKSQILCREITLADLRP